jgi:hypothetical protein
MWSDTKYASEDCGIITHGGSAQAAPPLWLTVVLAGAAGAMGWGIRGQYGHETGAAHARLPALYFSDHWYWEPDKIDMKPRRECWGSLLTALSGLAVYSGWVRKDRLA